MKSLYKQIKAEVDNMQLRRQSLLDEIEHLKYKKSTLYEIFLSWVRDKKKQLEIQGLIGQKERIGKLIANVDW